MLINKNNCPICMDHEAKIQKISADLESKSNDISALKEKLREKTIFCNDLLTELRIQEAKIADLEVKIENMEKLKHAFAPRAPINSTQGKLTPEQRIKLNEKREALKSKPKGSLDQNKGGHSSDTASPKAKRYYMPDAKRELLEKKRQEQSVAKKEKELAERQKVIDACRTHYGKLQANLRRAVFKDEYGTVIKDDRDKEILRFLRSLRISTSILESDESRKIVIKTVRDISKERKANGFDPTDSPKNGLDFEHWAAEALRNFGWEVSVTQGSGDQGIDIIATFEGVSVGIQCKRYSGTVGNKAVQEIFSGVKHMGLNKAAVLTNAQYTRSARELAKSTGVLLLTSEDIPTLHDIIRS